MAKIEGKMAKIDRKVAKIWEKYCKKLKGRDERGLSGQAEIFFSKFLRKKKSKKI